MVPSTVHMYSPFSPATVGIGQGPSLLLQLILTELLEAKEHLVETPPPTIAPYDWGRDTGSLNRVREHASLLEHAFPKLVKEAKKFQASLDKTCNKLIALLEPFMMACKENENLIFFLLKIERCKPLLLKLDPEGKLQEMVTEKYRLRGFTFHG